MDRNHLIFKPMCRMKKAACVRQKDKFPNPFTLVQGLINFPYILEDLTPSTRECICALSKGVRATTLQLDPI